MRGYLLDANHVSAHFNQNPSFMKKLREVPLDSQWRVCAITLGEIRASHEMSASTDQQRRGDYAAFVIEQYEYNALDITVPTSIYYAEIIGRIWQKHPPPSKKTRTDRHLLNHGVDMNDVWIVSSALDHGLTLLTNDAMTCIREVLPEFKPQCWTEIT
ncbi:MAG: type II toxin-antitoxin system VapC family toxin [Bryobacteraceae bacterium]